MFRPIANQEEASDFIQWAEENYKPFDEIKGIWHPIIQLACVKINERKAGWGLPSVSELYDWGSNYGHNMAHLKEDN